MSRSNPSEDVKTVNPALRFYSWSGDKGNFEYYDKEKKEKIEVALPFTFLPINRLVTLKGYDDDTKVSYWSNEVKDINKDPFIVQSAYKSGNTKVVKTEFTGLYKDIKSKLDALDISYVESLYIGVKNANKGLDLCNVQLKGSAIGTWIEFTKNNKVMEIAVQVKSFNEKKKGKVQFKEPVYTAINKISKEMNDQAIELDLELVEYLKGYFERTAAALSSSGTLQTEPTVAAPAATPKPEAAFDDSKHPQAQTSNVTSTAPPVDIIVGDDDVPEF